MNCSNSAFLIHNSAFLFLFFAEDRQLLPPNSVRLILNDWRDLQERDVEIPLYDRFKKYFPAVVKVKSQFFAFAKRLIIFVADIKVDNIAA